MLQRYRLRLGDGTVLLVDHEGLSTWLVDSKAMVQGGGSKEWRPLKELLAEQRVLAKYAARKKQKAASEQQKPRERAAPPIPEPQSNAHVQSPAAGGPPYSQIAAEEPTVLPAEASVASSIVDENIVPPSVDPSLPLGQPSSTWFEPPSIGTPASVQAVADDIAPLQRQVTDVEAPVLPSPSVLVLADNPGTQGEEPGLSKAHDELSIIRLKPLDEDPAPVAGGSISDDARNRPVFAATTQRRSGGDAALGWLASSGEALLAWWSDGLGNLARRLEPIFAHGPKHQTAAGSTRIAAPEPSHFREGAMPPRVPLKPPPDLSELPVLPLAKIDDAEDEGTLYGGDVYQGESWLQAAWRWTKRVMLIAGMVAGGILAGATWETWLPQAVELGSLIFSEIDRQRGLGNTAEHQQRALERAAQELPQLAPDTIKRILSRSSSGVLDPPEVFRQASEAAARGISALSRDEAQELASLWRRLLDGLTPAQRKVVREYESARTHRGTLPFEDRAVAELLAVGSRALPPQSLARLQTLSGRAVAAGLVPSARAR